MTDIESFSRNVADLPAGKLEYFKAGTGPNIIYLHPASGMRVSEALWRLSRRFQVWAPIVPGFDGTTRIDGVDSMPALADLLGSFIEVCVGGDSDVVGTSLGGWLGAWLAVRHPRRVRQLVLAAPAGFRAADAPPLSFEPEVMRAQLYAHPERMPAEEKSPTMRQGNRDALAYYGLGASHDPALIARLEEIECRTLILQGTMDVRVPAEAVRLIKQKIKHAQLVYIYDAAHSLEIDQPKRVGALIEDFLLRGEAFIVNPGFVGPDTGAVA